MGNPVDDILNINQSPDPIGDILNTPSKTVETTSPNPVDQILNLNSTSVPPINNVNTGSSWDQFKQKATDIASSRGYPVNVLLGQAALETGHGTSQFAKQRNNYFGMQAYDSNPDAASRYQTPESSINDYIDLIQKNPRYAQAWNQYLQDHNSFNLLSGIKQAGYATDPNYVSKVSNIPEFNQ